mgnify:CR=1 FL=1
MLTIRPSKTRLYQGFPGPLLGQAVCFYGLPLFCRNAVNICPAASGHFVQRSLRDKCPEAAGSVPTPEHAAGMGQEAFRGERQKRKMEGTHER